LKCIEGGEKHILDFVVFYTFCISSENYIDGMDIAISAIAIIRKEKYNDEKHAALNKKIDSAYSVLKQGKFR